MAREKANKHQERIGKVFSFLLEQPKEPNTEFIPTKIGELAGGTGLTPLNTRETLMIMLEREYITIECSDNTLYITVLGVPKKYQRGDTIENKASS